MTEQKRAAAQEQQAIELIDLARRTFKRQKPLLILVHYNHEADKLSFLNQIHQRAAKHEFGTRNYDPLNNDEHGTSKLYSLLEKDVERRILSLVVSVPRDNKTDEPDSEFLIYINLHRDNILHSQLHFVLFLRESEAAAFIHGAPDLWDFRHQTFYLERENEASDNLLWQNMDELKDTLYLADEDKQVIDEHVKRARQLIDDTDDKQDKAQLFLDLSKWLSRHDAHAMAVEAAIEGISCLDNKVSNLLSELKHHLGYSLSKTCHFSEAISHYKSSLSVSRQLVNKRLEASTLNNISEIYRITGDFDNALKYLNETLSLSKEIDDKFLKSRALNNIGQLYTEKDEYDTALDFLKQALKIRKIINDKAGEGVTVNNIAVIYFARKDYDTALMYLEQALLIIQDEGDSEGSGTILNNMAQIFVNQNNYEAALHYLQESLSIHESNGNRLGEATTCHNLALAFDQKGDVQQAIRYSNRALTIQIQTDSPDAEKTEQYLVNLKQQLSQQNETSK
jgi:tetratricopeptide (TPR) repeat protein